MAWVGSPAQLQMSLFLEYPFPRISGVMFLKKKAEPVTRDIASSDWLKWRPFVCFGRKVYLKINKSICDCARARP